MTPSTQPKHVDPLLLDGGKKKKTNPHVWGKPVAGQGRSEICTQCGERKTAVTENISCDGPRVATTGKTKHSYDPLEG